MQLTPHFTDAELCGTSVEKYQKKNLEEGTKQLGKLYMLAGFAERIREIVGKPLIISSGFRCVQLNNYLGGSLTSQHLYHEALDIIVKGMRPNDIFQKIVVSDLKYDQIILEQNAKGTQWVHISIGSKKEKLQYKNGKYTKLGEK